MSNSPHLPAVNREWQLVKRPVGWPTPEDFALVEAPVSVPGEGLALGPPPPTLREGGGDWARTRDRSAAAGWPTTPR